ncbi:MAG: hypothetical protein ACPGWR_26750 [Ardenticatenaceae bacterium]
MFRIKSYMFVLLAVLLFAFPAWSVSQAAKSAQEPAVCLFFTETGNEQGGYSVSDEGGIMFGSAFQQWGVEKVGYPISRRYEQDGFVTQAFQKMIMQWQPESNSVALVNIFDDLHNAGHDESLLVTRQTPEQLPAGWDGDIPFEEVVKKRHALLDVRPALRDAYFASDDPLTFYGLPTSEVKDMESHYAIRLQRVVLQEWKEDVAWAKAGDVTIANGGDMAKEFGVVATDALTPTAESPCAPVTLPPATDPQSSSEASPPAAEPPSSSEGSPSAAEPPSSSEASPPATDTSSANACTSDMALVEISHGLAEEINIILQGPQNSGVAVPSRETKRYCMTPGAYSFKTLALISGQERGKKTFTSGCQCWRLYWFTPGRSCTCSNSPADYKPLPNQNP